MKHFFLACLFPTLLTAQSMQLTEQLGKTVLYGDIALSPDGTQVAWVQSTAATISKRTYVRGTSGNTTAIMVNIGSTGERRASRRRDHRRQLFCIELSSVLFLETGKRAGGVRRARARACAGHAARLVSAYPVLPETLPLLLFQGLYR